MTGELRLGVAAALLPGQGDPAPLRQAANHPILGTGPTADIEALGRDLDAGGVDLSGCRGQLAMRVDVFRGDVGLGAGEVDLDPARLRLARHGDPLSADQTSLDGLGRAGARPDIDRGGGRAGRGGGQTRTCHYQGYTC